MKVTPVEVNRRVEYEYLITLSQRELEVLLGILAYIGGHDGKGGNRDVLDQIYLGLSGVNKSGYYPKVIEPTTVIGDK